MLRAIATVGYLGCLPRVGGVLACCAGLTLAGVVFLATGSSTYVCAAWFLCLSAMAWALPRAMEDADIPDRQIVIDQFTGVWLAAAPVIPLSALMLPGGVGMEPLLLVLAVPLLFYQLLLRWPLRRMRHSPRPLMRFVDDLLAGTLAMILTVLALVVALYALPLAPVERVITVDLMHIDTGRADV